MKNFTYYRPKTTDEAVGLLEKTWGKAELLAGGIYIDRVLICDGADDVSAVSHCVDVVPRGKTYGYVIENRGFPLIKAERIVVRACGFTARPNANEAADDVRRIGERDLSAAKPDAAARRRLARDGDVAGGNGCDL